ncbi:MAG: hypothetical protein KGQ60_19560, partial [Planctomycetes bacterium]|nr:hypothetical protein [Planctomycetota bacterium]
MRTRERAPPERAFGILNIQNMSTQQKRIRKDDGSRPPKSDGSSMLDRSPPFDLSAEACVLGCLILNPDVANDLTLILRTDDFYDDANRKIYSAIISMFDSG